MEFAKYDPDQSLRRSSAKMSVQQIMAQSVDADTTQMFAAGPDTTILGGLDSTRLNAGTDTTILGGLDSTRMNAAGVDTTILGGLDSTKLNANAGADTTQMDFGPNGQLDESDVFQSAVQTANVSVKDSRFESFTQQVEQSQAPKAQPIVAVDASVNLKHENVENGPEMMDDMDFE